VGCGSSPRYPKALAYQLQIGFDDMPGWTVAGRSQRSGENHRDPSLDEGMEGMRLGRIQLRW